jgi:hypothetical protein
MREADLTTFVCRMSWKSGSLNLLEPPGPHRACYGTAYKIHARYPLPYLQNIIYCYSDKVSPYLTSAQFVWETVSSLNVLWYDYLDAQHIQSENTVPLNGYTISKMGDSQRIKRDWSIFHHREQNYPRILPGRIKRKLLFILYSPHTLPNPKNITRHLHPTNTIKLQQYNWTSAPYKHYKTTTIQPDMCYKNIIDLQYNWIYSPVHIIKLHKRLPEPILIWGILECNLFLMPTNYFCEFLSNNQPDALISLNIFIYFPLSTFNHRETLQQTRSHKCQRLCYHNFSLSWWWALSARNM